MLPSPRGSNSHSGAGPDLGNGPHVLGISAALKHSSASHMLLPNPLLLLGQNWGGHQQKAFSNICGRKSWKEPQGFFICQRMEEIYYFLYHKCVVFLSQGSSHWLQEVNDNKLSGGSSVR